MKPLLLPLICLLAGSGVGYWFGANPSSASTVPTPPASGNATTSAKTSTRSSAAPAATLTLTLDDLIADASNQSAGRYANSLTPAELQAALRLLDDKPPSPNASLARSELMRVWSRTDFNAAWQAALALKGNHMRGMCLQAMAGELAKRDPQAALKTALSLGMGGDRAGALRAIFSDWATVDAAAAVAYWNAHPELPSYQGIESVILVKVAQENPALAAEQALKIRVQSSRAGVLGTVVSAWMNLDREAALRWVTSIPDQTARLEALSYTTSLLVIDDPVKALELCQQFPEGDDRKYAMQRMMMDWLRRDPAAAIDYMARSDPKDEDNLVLSLQNSMQNLTPPEQAGLYTRLPEGKLRQAAILSAAKDRLDRSNYAGAVEALNLVPDSDHRDLTLLRVGDDWGRKDPQAAENWLKQQPDSSDRDLVVASYVDAIASKDPMKAIQWLATIPDPKVREAATKNLALRWFRVDAKAAQAWLDTTSLRDLDKQTIAKQGVSGSSSIKYTPNVGNRR